MARKKLAQIEKRIEKIKKELTVIAEMRPGTLSKQYKDPVMKTGEYYQLSYTHKMKSRTEYIRPVFLEDIKNQTKNYKSFKKLIELWIDLSIEFSRLQMRLAKDENKK